MSKTRIATETKNHDSSGAVLHLPPVDAATRLPGRTEGWTTLGSPSRPSPRRSLFSVVATQATERGVYAASTWHKPWDVAESPSARKSRAVKRPKGRAPALILVEALNAYQGRGRMVHCFSITPVPEFAQRPSAKHQSDACCSLSLRERAGVRGKGANYQTAYRTSPGTGEVGEFSSKGGGFPKEL